MSNLLGAVRIKVHSYANSVVDPIVVWAEELSNRPIKVHASRFKKHIAINPRWRNL